MSNIQIDDCTVNVPLYHVKSELESNGYLVFGEYDYDEMVDHLTNNDYVVFNSDSDTNDYLEGAASSDVMAWLRGEWGDMEILAELNPETVAEFAEHEELVKAAPALSEVSIADLMAEVARRLENAERVEKWGQEAARRNVQKGERITQFFRKLDCEVSGLNFEGYDSRWIEFNRELDSEESDG